MAASLTVANSVLGLTVEALFPQAQILQGYAADDAYAVDAIENGEFSMGIDGKLSAGFVFNPIPFTLTLQADSASLTLFEQVWEYEVQNRTKLEMALNIKQKSNGKQYDLITGFMQSYKAPDAKKILQPGVVVLTFGRISPSPL